MLPADERFKPAQRSGVQRDDRLIEQPEFTALECAFEIVFNLQFGLCLGQQFRNEQLEAPFAQRLGPVHRDIGIAQDVLGRVGTGLRDADSDARPGVDLTVRDREGRPQCGQDAFGARDCSGLALHVFEENGEFVAAHARQ